MSYRQWMTLVVGTCIVLTASAQAGERKDLRGRGRVEVVFGGGSPDAFCEGCDTRRVPRSERYPVYRDDESFEYGGRDADFGRGDERWRDRAEAAREREKDRREAFREREKDRQEWVRERAKAEREAWKEEEKARREWEKEREKADREAWKEWSKARQEQWKR